MHIVLSIRCCNKKQDVYRFIIKGLKLNSIFDDHGSKSRFCYAASFTVRDSYTFSYTGSTFFFSRIYKLSVSFLVLEFSALSHKFNSHIEGFLFRTRSCIKGYAFLIKKFGYPHIFNLLFNVYSSSFLF